MIPPRRYVPRQLSLPLPDYSSGPLVELSEADDTEAISKEVRILLSNRSVFYRRFAEAYPEVIYKTERIAKRMEEIQVE